MYLQDTFLERQIPMMVTTLQQYVLAALGAPHPYCDACCACDSFQAGGLLMFVQAHDAVM